MSVSEKVRAMPVAERKALIANMTKLQNLCIRKIELLEQMKRTLEREWRRAHEE